MAERSYETHIDLGVIGEIEAVVKYDYRPAEAETRDYPGCSARVTVNDIILQGVVLSPKHLSDLIAAYDTDTILAAESEFDATRGYSD